MKAIEKIVRRVVPQPVIRKYSSRLIKPYMSMTDRQRERRLLKEYRRYTGKTMDMEHPVTFNEKLQWYKLYYDHPDFARIVCKVGFKDYIREKLGEGHTIPLYGAWTDVDAIDWDALPKEFVLKSNAQSFGRGILIVKDKSELDIPKLKKELKIWQEPMKTVVNSFNRAYYDVVPQILAEEYVKQVGDQLYDYKFFCFNGEPCCVYVAIDHYAGQVSKISFYDLDWKEMDVTYGEHERNHIEKPKHFDEMLAYARTLSKPFPFVRVDFFETEEKLYLAEMTFYSSGGYTEFKPDELDRKMGELFVLPEKSKLGVKHRSDI